MKLDHIAINVSDIKKSIEWYVQNLSASVDYEDQTWAMLNVNNTGLALTISQEHPPHIAFNISDLSELQEQKIKKHRDGSYYVYVSDPDDNVIEKIYWDVVKK